MSLDNSVPGFPEMSDWPIDPVPPLHIHDFGSYRDPSPHCTFYVELKDSTGIVFPFFFDRFLGRLCYGTRDDRDDAAFIKRGSKFESEAIAAIETAAASAEFSEV